MGKTVETRIMALCLVTLLMILTGCAGRNVQDVSLVDSSATPDMVKANFSAFKGRTVQWGGLVVEVLRDNSPVLLEVLSYPLDSYGNPEESYNANGRFFVELPVSLERGSFRVGRYITVVGSIGSEMEVRAGEVGKRLPVLNQVGVYVWDSYRRERQQVRPVFSFGLGIRL